MAKTRSSRSLVRTSRWPWVVLFIAVALAALAFLYRAPALGYAQTVAAYSARVACSCRFVGGRSLSDCKKDKLDGMELVTLAEDVEAKSVTARFPLIASDTATYREGYGCVLEKWDS